MVSDSAAWNGLVMRVDKAPFNDVRVRQAMRLAINRPQFRDLVYGGRGLLGNDMFGIAAAEYDHSIPQRQQDIEQAKSLLRAAGQSGVTVQHADDNDRAGYRAIVLGGGSTGHPGRVQCQGS